MVTSSAVVGSSAISSFGSHASAIAIITRCRMPPESWCGYSSTRCRDAGCRPLAASRPPVRARLPRGQPWCSRTASTIWSPTVNTGLSEVIGSWKIMAMSLPRICRISRLGAAWPGPPRRARPGRGSRRRLDLPGGYGISRITESDGDRLPLPLSPTMPSVSPGSHGTHAVDRARDTRVGLEVGAEVFDLQYGIGHVQVSVISYQLSAT